MAAATRMSRQRPECMSAASEHTVASPRTQGDNALVVLQHTSTAFNSWSVFRITALNSSADREFDVEPYVDTQLLQARRNRINKLAILAAVGYEDFRHGPKSRQNRPPHSQNRVSVSSIACSVSSIVSRGDELARNAAFLALFGRSSRVFLSSARGLYPAPIYRL